MCPAAGQVLSPPFSLAGQAGPFIVGTQQVTLGGQDVNAIMVREGHAWAYDEYLEPGSALPALEHRAREKAARQGYAQAQEALEQLRQ